MILNLSSIRLNYQQTQNLSPTKSCQGNSEITKLAVPLKYLSNFRISLEMLLINCKVEVKLKWTKYCVLSAAGNDNTNVNIDSITFTIKNTKLYVPV